MFAWEVLAKSALGKFDVSEILGEFRYVSEILGEFRYMSEILGEFRYRRVVREFCVALLQKPH